jgi:hypothetical protein
LSFFSTQGRATTECNGQRHPSIIGETTNTGFAPFAYFVAVVAVCVGKERRVNVCHHRVFVIRGMNHECFRYVTFPFEAEDQGCFIEGRFNAGYRQNCLLREVVLERCAAVLGEMRC